MKKYSILSLILLVHLCIYAQQTSLTIDNQTPGWLSSKINYSDQLTVQNLTVTGYLNTTDLEFIGLLMSKSLNGNIDLENTSIVKDSKNEENTLPTSAFNLSESYKLRRLSLPSTLAKMGNWNRKTGDSYEQALTLDTLIIGGKNLPHLTSYNICNCSTLVIREGVDSLGAYTDDVESLEQIITSNYSSNLKKVSLPNGIKFIGNGFFRDCTELTALNLPESLEEIHSGAFKGTNFLPSTLCLPSNLRIIHIGAFYNTNVTELICPKTLQIMGGLHSKEDVGKVPVFDVIQIHFKGDVPQFLRKPSTSGLRPRPWPSFITENWTIYTSTEYLNNYTESTFSNGTIIPEIEIESIDFDIPNKIYISDKLLLSAQYSPTEATDKAIIWKTDSSNVRIEGNTIIANQIGRANIVAQSSFSKVKNEKFINVYKHVSGVNIQEKEINLSIGQSQKATVEIYPIGENDGEVLWISDNPQIAEVTVSGTIVAKKAGRCNVICSSVDGGYKDFCNVFVIQPVTGITLDRQSVELTSVGESVQLQATVLPEDAENKKIKWSSSNETICKVSENGLVTAVKAGNATITVSTEDGNFVAQCSVSIRLKVTNVQLEKHELTLKVGEFEKLGVQITPLDANNKNIKWTSEDETIATVNNAGVVTGLKAGKVRIYATSGENSEISDYCTVTITQPVTGITLDKQAVELTSIGESIQLQATVLPEDAENQNVRWSSSNEKVCIVSGNGNIVGLSDGVAIIIATTEEGGFLATCQVTVNTASNIDRTRDNLTKIKVNGNSVYIANKLPNDIVIIYSTVGEIVYKGYDDRVVLSNGIYIVKVSNLYYKIVL